MRKSAIKMLDAEIARVFNGRDQKEREKAQQKLAALDAETSKIPSLADAVAFWHYRAGAIPQRTHLGQRLTKAMDIAGQLSFQGRMVFGFYAVRFDPSEREFTIKRRLKTEVLASPDARQLIDKALNGPPKLSEAVHAWYSNHCNYNSGCYSGNSVTIDRVTGELADRLYFITDSSESITTGNYVVQYTGYADPKYDEISIRPRREIP